MSVQPYSLLALGTLIQNVCLQQETAESDAVTALEEMLRETAIYKVRVPDKLHFVWIGEVSRADLSYLSVWHRFNPDKALFLWTDKSSDYCCLFQHSLKEYSHNHPDHGSLYELQNAAFTFIYPRITSGETFNTAASHFLVMNGIPEQSDKTAHNNNTDQYQGMVTLCDIQTLFTDELLPYRKLYYYELILRGNLAAASDIIRLLILYRIGGVYIDLDTLPDVEKVFRATQRVENTLGMANHELICLAKSAAFLAWFDGNENITASVDFYIRKITHLSENDYTKLRESVAFDIMNINIRDIPPLGEVLSYPDLMKIGAVHFLPGIFFNNFLCAAPGSRLIKIILMNIARRYAILRREDTLFASPDTTDQGRILENTDNYRNNNDFFSDAFTLSLTGPGMIVNTLLRLVFRIMPLGSQVPPERLAERLQDQMFGLTQKDQTLDTPMGLK